MEFLNISRESIDLNILCKSLVESHEYLNRCLKCVSKNPDWLEENAKGNIDVENLIKLIENSYTNKQYREILPKIIDVTDGSNVNDEIFLKLLNYPYLDVRNEFLISLSHKELTEKQLISLCQLGVTFECYFELAILYYTCENFTINQLKKFLEEFKCCKYSDMYPEMISELECCYKASNEDKFYFIKNISGVGNFL